jgi:hypothetical protein
MIAEYPVTKTNRINLACAFRHVPRVDISIECVLEDQMGMAFVDKPETPSAFMIKIGPFHYCAGDVTSTGKREVVKSIQPYNLFMSALPGWAEAFKDIYGERFFEIKRYMLSSENISVEHLRYLCQESKFVNDVKRMDVTLLKCIKGKDHFIDISDFDSPEDFVKRGYPPQGTYQVYFLKPQK